MKELAAEERPRLIVGIVSDIRDGGLNRDPPDPSCMYPTVRYRSL